MNNPFEKIDERLTNIENLLHGLNQKAKIANKNDDEENLLNVAEAANFLKLSIPTIYSKVSKGELPVMKRTKRLYFFKTDLLEYLKKGKRKSITEIESETDHFLSSLKKK